MFVPVGNAFEFEFVDAVVFEELFVVGRVGEKVSADGFEA